MTQQALSATRDTGVETLLAREWADAARSLAGIEAGLRGLLGASDPGLFNDRVVAQVRALVEDLARQLTDELGDAPYDGGVSLADALIANPAVLGHAHALALEGELAERLGKQLAVDPALSPLVQRLAASDTAAFDLIALQASFIQAQRRGELELAEWPLEVLQAAFSTARGGDEPGSDFATLEAMVPADVGEGDNRLARIERVARVMDRDALDVRQAGIALFVTALALRVGLERDTAVLLSAESAGVRLALALRACGLEAADIERQLFALHPDADLPDGFAGLSADRAAALLRSAGGIAGA